MTVTSSGAGAGVRLVGLDRRPDGDELGEVGAELLELDVEPHADDPVGAEDVGLRLHARHRQLAGVAHCAGSPARTGAPRA
jgi:hypothetical protein